MITPTIHYEESLWNNGYIHVAGVDEAGKGPLAGPVTAGAVIIHRGEQVVPFVRDSKYMTARNREKAFDLIKEYSSAYGVGIVSAHEIDEIGIDLAVKKAMLLALHAAEQQLATPLSYVIVDGSKTKPLEVYPNIRIKTGGLYHYSISAGSVLAKVTRDRLMMILDKEYPQYHFNKHVGYGTKLHMEMLNKYGPSPIHRKTFAPVTALLQKS